MSNRGLTLPELLLVLVLLALGAGLALPRVMMALDAGLVRAEAAAVVTALDTARGAAMRLGAVARLTLADSGYQVVVQAPGGTTVVWRGSGAAARGVHLTGAGQPILFGPSGVAMGAANRTVQLARGAVTRRVVVSRLGRLTW